ncbi:MAG: antibiotic biosynthesis monooxygenase [Myxococcota bacterium]
MHQNQSFLTILVSTLAAIASGCATTPAESGNEPSIESSDGSNDEPNAESDSDHEIRVPLVAEGITAINIMEPAGEDRQRLVELLSAGMTDTMRTRDGFGSGALHRSMDSDHIVNVARWRSTDDLAAAAELVESGGAPKMAEAFSLATPSFHPYTIVGQFSPTPEAVPTITEDGGLVTAINLLDPSESSMSQSELVEAMSEALEQEVLAQPGFVSATLYRSEDSSHVINYAQWDSAKSLGTMAERIESGGAPLLMGVFSTVAPDYHAYEVAEIVMGEQ